MNRIHFYLWFVISMLAFNSGHASVAKEAEIHHLLDYIENSQCTFVRNGSSHDAVNAKKHIENKYNYLKSRIDTTEDFIKYSATKSSISGKQYKVKCAGKDYLTGQWLNEELRQYRSNALRPN